MIPDESVPFILLGSIVYCCHQGKDTNKKKNDKNKEKKIQELVGRGNAIEHYHHKSRELGQPSKKTGCPVKFDV